MIVPLGCVSFTIVNVAVGTIQEVIAWLQLLFELVVDVGAKVGRPVGARNVGARVKSRVGVGSKVFVGTGVSVDMSVGGSRVLVGSASCVCATNVNAAATEVFCTLKPSMVGVACAPQALINTANNVA